MMNKKYLVLWTFVLGFIFSGLISFSNAQTFKESDMDNVGFRFCNEGTGSDQLQRDINLSVEPGSEKDLCMYFFNVGEKTVDFVYGFSEGKIGKSGEPMCEVDMTTGNKFSRFIPLMNERRVSVKGQTYQTIEEKIKIPMGINGIIYGCVAYKLEVPEYKSMGGMFDLVVRRTAHINLFVGGEGSIKNSIKIYSLKGGVFTTNKKIKAELDKENNLKVSFLVGNEGNISQNVIITGKVYNALGFQKDFAVDAKQLTPGEKYTFSSDVGILPFYKGFFTVKFNVQNTPVFDFDPSGIDEKNKQSGTVTENTTLFIFSRTVVIIFIVILFVLYRAFFARRKNNIFIL